MLLKLNVIFVLATFCLLQLTQGAVKRCYNCRSRGELGSCKDPFAFNTTKEQSETGVEIRPCASGWCGKIVEADGDLKEEYGVATQRFCYPRGPSDNEDRCDYTTRNTRRVLICFCWGDLCNSSTHLKTSSWLFLAVTTFTLFKNVLKL